MLAVVITSFLLFQPQASDTVLASRIQHLLDVVLTTYDEKQETAAKAEAREIFKQRGLPTISEVGDEAAYDFVLLTCSSSPTNLQKQVLRKAREAAADRYLPPDAAAYCASHARQERAKERAEKHAPADPKLRDQIKQLFKSDQEVRNKDNFDSEKMTQADREHTVALEAIFSKYGVPTYRMVGPQAASDFVTMIQHQSPEFRKRVLPKLKANVEVGQADPGSYATVYDRSQNDDGKAQRYGQNLTCDRQNPKLHTGPIEDESHVNQRRAEIGLLRLKLYVRLVQTISPNNCPGPPTPRPQD